MATTGRTWVGDPLQRGAGVLFMIFASFLLFAGTAEDFRRSRHVSGPVEARRLQIATRLLGGVFGLAGVGMALFGSGITIDRAKGTARKWSSAGPFRFGPVLPLTDFDRVRVERLEGDRKIYRVLLAGPRGARMAFKFEYLGEDRARAFAQEVSAASGLRVEGRGPSDAELNRALGIWMEFGAARATSAEEHWRRDLPGVDPALLSEICRAVEEAAGELAGRVMAGELGQDAGRSELGRRFPALDGERLSQAWSQGLYFAARG